MSLSDKNKVLKMPKDERLKNVRQIMGAIKNITKNSDVLRSRYKKARSIMHIFGHSAFYEVSARCNLSCKDCYFFEGVELSEQSGGDKPSWEALFKREKKRGVLMGNFFGAEPGFEQETLLLGSEHIPYGNLSTNGSIYIDPNVSMRIYISSWGLEQTEQKTRGNSFLNNALRNYAGDERAIVCLTVNRENIGDIEGVAYLCREHGIPLTFNMYSPTHGHKERLALPSYKKGSPNNKPRDLTFDRYALEKTRDTIDMVIDCYSDTVLYLHNYNHWVTKEGPLYCIDEATGIAKNCGSRISENYLYYDVNTRQNSQDKCIHPSVDCYECRVYGAAYASRIFPAARDVKSAESFADWLDFMELSEKLFVYKRN